jgi:hypothetical protein
MQHFLRLAKISHFHGSILTGLGLPHTSLARLRDLKRFVSSYFVYNLAILAILLFHPHLDGDKLRPDFQTTWKFYGVHPTHP